MDKSKVFNVGLCAYGMSGKLFHAPFIHLHPQFNLHTIVRRSDPSTIAEYPETLIRSSIIEMCADPNIDIIVINTPIQLHYEHALIALNHNKHLIIEKPLAVTSEQAIAIQTLAEEKNKEVFVYQNRRLDRDFRTVQSIVQSGDLGNIYECEIRFDRYRTKAGSKIHKEGPQEGAGALYDLGSHIIDQAIQLYGKPSKLWAYTDILKDDIQADDYFEVVLFYPNKLKVRLISNTFVVNPTYGYAVYGSMGTLFQNRSDRQEALLDARIRPDSTEYPGSLTQPDGHMKIMEDGRAKLVELYSKPTSYMDFYHSVANTLTGSSPNKFDIAQPIQCLKLIEKAHLSKVTKQVINLD